MSTLDSRQSQTAHAGCKMVSSFLPLRGTDTVSQPGSVFTACSSCAATAAVGPLKYFLNCLQINDSHASYLFFIFGGNNLLSEKCGYGLPTRADYAPFYAGLLFPFYGSMKQAIDLTCPISTLARIGFLNGLGWASPADPPGSRGSQGLCDSQVGVRKATRPCDSSAVSRRCAGGGEEERKQPLRTDG